MKAEIVARLEILQQHLKTVNEVMHLNEKVQDLAALNAQIEGVEDFWGDPERAQEQLKQQARLKSVVENVQSYGRDVADLAQLFEMADEEQDAALEADCMEKLAFLEKTLARLRIEGLLSGEADANNCFLEINSGAGGTEAQDWVAMLVRMYVRWAERRGFRTEVIDEFAGEEAGFKSISIKVSGHQAYG